ncbi:MAG: hypothetical protein IPM29_02410 [Planctomycetes bacterium]|nr:hypothetical protein [Planctomycetota bacterium]
MRTLLLALALLPGPVDCQRPAAPAAPDPEAVAEAYDRDVGALFSGRGPGRGGAPAPEQAHAALERLCAVPASGLETRAADLRSVLRAYLEARPRGGDLVRQVDALRAEHTWDGSRALDKRKGDPRTLLLVAIDSQLHQTLPVRELRAHPAAAAFPGAVPDDAPRVARTLQVDTQVPRWHSTALWAPAGETVHVEVRELSAGATLTVVVGSHTDSVVGRPRWERFPRISRRFRIDAAGDHEVGNAFGGLIYVACDRTDAGVLQVRIRGAVEAPVFELGATSIRDWRAALRDRPAPFGELICDHIVWTLPAGVLRSCDDPDEVLRFWSEVVSVQDQLAHATRASPERFVLDRQISVGYMHSGYPLMGPVSAAAAAVDVATLREKGNWGMFHELGHNHQTEHYGRYANVWTFDDSVEVTVNVFSAWTYVAALQRPAVMGHQHWRTDLLAENLAASFTAKPYGEKSHRERCLFWVHLIEEFGWDQVRAVFGTYAEMPRDQLPRDDLGKRSLFLEVWSRQVGHDLGPLFAAWGIEVTEAAAAHVAALPAFTPRVALPAR